jgi:phosphoribosylanthranilate isomerase
MPIWIKICANTTLDDALMAADLGADAVGFVFAPSKRQVTVDQVAAITTHLPVSVEKVGVFVGWTPEDLERVAYAAVHSGLSAVQLHGGGDPAFAADLQSRLGPAFAIIQTAHWTIGEDATSAESLARQLGELGASPNPDRLLLDAKLGASSGGLGIPFDWSRAQPILAANSAVRIIVAGGLNPDNVARAVESLRPYGVDVASGVEQSPGRKDPARLRAFVQAARGVL